MQKLIEFKLHNGQFPYFVKDVIGGIDVNGKRYGISRDTTTCYLPETVRTLDAQEFIDIVKGEIIYAADPFGDEPLEMNSAEKEDFCIGWLHGHRML